MRKGLLVIMFLGWLFGPPSAVQEASKAYEAQQYAKAVAGFSTAHDAYPRQHPQLNFNTAQAWLRLDSVAQATSWYGKVTNASQQAPQLGSWAWNNLGCIYAAPPASSNPAAGQGMPMMGGQMPGQGGADPKAQLEQALQAFKDALKLDPDNEIARYNYELIKHKIRQQQQQQQQDQQQEQEQEEEQQKDKQDQQPQKDQQKDSPQNQENKGNQGQGEGENAAQMSEVEAQRLLDAMNANEKKFLQQIEKGKKHRTYNEDGPDW
jgi:tetratricopeptide (TPR) repeat protein